MSTAFSEIVYNWLINAQYCFLPGTCILCRQSTFQKKDLCLSCECTLARIKRPCRNCGLPLPSGKHLTRHCGACLVLSPPFQRLLAPYCYQPPIAGLIAAFKYNRKIVHGRVLSELLCDFLENHYSPDTLPTLLIPVPLFPGRVRIRGYNQALEISRYLSARLKLPINRKLIKRARNTTQQTGLNAKNRALNMRSAFQIEKGFRFKPATTIALVDDVVTTGATVKELSKVLLNAGAKEVHVWALARTIS